MPLIEIYIYWIGKQKGAKTIANSDVDAAVNILEKTKQ